MADKSWKALERRVAKRFGCGRTPLSGGNGKVTRSDTLHKRLFIEVKQRATHTVATLFRATKVQAKAEEKIPLLVLQEKGRPGSLYVIAEEDFWGLVAELAKGS